MAVSDEDMKLIFALENATFAALDTFQPIFTEILGNVSSSLDWANSTENGKCYYNGFFKSFLINFCLFHSTQR